MSDREGYVALRDLEQLMMTFSQNLSQREMFNFSLEEAYDILFERQSEDSNLTPAAEAALVAVYVLLIVSGLATNILIILVVARRSASRTPRNLYVVNLAVSDLSLCLVCMPFTLVGLLRRKWALGSFLCKLVPAMQGTNVMVSVGTITAIAMDRYCAIVRRCEDANSRRRVIWCLILLWGLSAMVTLPLVLFQRVEKVAVREIVLYEVCVERWPSHASRCAYAGVTLLLHYVIPSMAVGVVHAKIASHLGAHARRTTRDADARRARRELQRNKRTTQGTVAQRDAYWFLAHYLKRNETFTYQRNREKPTKSNVGGFEKFVPLTMLAVVAAVFGVSWLPLQALTLAADLHPGLGLTSPQYLYAAFAACHVLAMSSAATNPVLYGWLNTNFRREFLLMLPLSIRSCKCAKTPEELEDEADDEDTQNKSRNTTGNRLMLPSRTTAVSSLSNNYSPPSPARMEQIPMDQAL